MATSDVTIAQDGGQGNVKLHPYLVTLIRWCVSCLWSTATVLLHRLMTAPLQPIAGPKPSISKAKLPKRAAGTEHLHPEPRVECQLLHQPEKHTHDVIFVHGLYGSLGNTWRQGDWRPKYRSGPQKVTLRDHSVKKTCYCQTGTKSDTTDTVTKADTVHSDSDFYNITFNEEMGLKMKEKLKKIIPQDNDLITEKFYNNTLINQVEIVDNYETQANFVRDLFEKCDKSNGFYTGYYSSETNNCYFENKNCSSCFNDNEFNRYTNTEDKYNRYNDSDIKLNENNDLEPKYNELENKYKNYNEPKTIYNESQSNFNRYNESEYKYNESKTIYNTYNESASTFNRYNDSKYNYNESDSNFKEYNESKTLYNTLNECICNKKQCEVGCGCTCDECYSSCWPRDWIKQDYPGARVISINYTSDPYLWRPLWVKENKRLSLHERAEQMIGQLLNMGVGEKPIIWVGHSKGGLFIKQIYCEAYEAYKKLNNIKTEKNTDNDEVRTNSVINNEIVTEKTLPISVFKTDMNNGLQVDSDKDTKFNISMENEFIQNKIIFNGTDDQIEASIKEALQPRSFLWSQSKGFMFYSVPHRGSPLADIKTPVTARSVELLEISKDCDLVLELQSRWLAATSAPRPPVRSFVETCRTLMSVLWLRIVSVDSADAGIGTLLGVSVDHREICKPSSRKCLLYTELTDLIDEALKECSC